MLKSGIGRLRPCKWRDSVQLGRCSWSSKSSVSPISHKHPDTNDASTPFTGTVDGDQSSNVAALDLLNRLFPDYTSSEIVEKPAIAKRIPISLRPKPSSTAAEKTQSRARPNRGPSDDERLFAQVRNRANLLNILIVQNVSLNLTVDDFCKLMPRGRHLTDWSLENGGIQQVIPGRDPISLQRKNFYYLLFKSPLSAFIYCRRATRVSKLAHMYTPKSVIEGKLLSDVRHQRLIEHNEDPRELIRSYTLSPPSQLLKVHQLSRPLLSIVEDVLKYAGYPRLAQMRDKAPGRALVRLELQGRVLQPRVLSKAIEDQERSRNLAWSGGEIGSIVVKRLRDYLPSRRHLTEARASEGPDDEPDVGNAEATDEDHDTDQSFICELDTQEQAHAFVRFWHRRTIHVPVSNATVEESSAILDAEVLW